jgi:hypothetical protein
MRLLTVTWILFLFSEGVMSSEKDTSAADTWIEFEYNSEKCLIIKAADSRNRPAGDYRGKKDLETALKSDNGGYCLLYIIFPNREKDLSLSYSDSFSNMVTRKTHPIFRMPDSPYYTYVLINPDHPGILTISGKIPDSTAKIDLAKFSAAISKLALRWHDTMISFEKLPMSLFGKTAK